MLALTPEQEALKQAALAATPGKWSWWTSNSYLRLSSERGGDGDILHGARLSDGCCTVDISEANRTFIERANPAAILAILAQLEAVQPIPDVLFDGNAVYEEITRKLGKGHCISAEAVSTTLDAVVRLIRAAKSAPGEPGQ